MHENILEVAQAGVCAQVIQRALRQQAAGVDDADAVTEFFHLAHHMGGEDDRLAPLAAFADEGDDGTRGHHVQADGGLVENHHLGIMDQHASDRGLLFHARG